jgi:alanine racemase
VKRHPSVSVAIDPARLRRNAEEIASHTGVPVHAVVKADAYGLGLKTVVPAVDPVVHGYCVFGLAEARDLRPWTGKPILCLGPADGSADDYLEINARPAVSTIEQARRLRSASPALCVDTGMQRFACPPEDVPAALDAGQCTEAFTHAVRPDQAARLLELLGSRRAGLKLHAAGSKLLADSTCRLDAVRPGLALYRSAVRISASLAEVRDSRGPAGYRGFVVPRHGVILCGYLHGLRPGPCLISARKSRVIEVGMQSAFVECQENDRLGDEVLLLGDGLEGDELSLAWNASPQEVLVSLLRCLFSGPACGARSS